MTASPPRQETVWSLRHERRWGLKRIAHKFGVSQPAVCQMLIRAGRELELARIRRDPPPKRRLVRPLSLSKVHNV